MVDSPFAAPHLGRIDNDGRLPLLMFVQAAIRGSLDDQITNRHDAWQETALLLIQHILSAETYGEGEAAAQLYLTEQPPAHQQPLTLATLHQSTAAFIADEPGGGRDAAERVLAAADERAVTGATRFLFITVVGSSGLPAERIDHFLHRLTPKLV